MPAQNMNTDKIVIVHQGFGVFLGFVMDMPVFSKVDAHGMDVVCPFPSEKEANEFVSKWDRQMALNFRLVKVESDVDGGMCSAAALRKAGLNEEEIGELAHAEEWQRIPGHC